MINSSDLFITGKKLPGGWSPQMLPSETRLDKPKITDQPTTSLLVGSDGWFVLTVHLKQFSSYRVFRGRRMIYQLRNWTDQGSRIEMKFVGTFAYSVMLISMTMMKQGAIEHIWIETRINAGWAWRFATVSNIIVYTKRRRNVPVQTIRFSKGRSLNCHRRHRNVIDWILLSFTLDWLIEWCKIRFSHIAKDPITSPPIALDRVHSEDFKLSIQFLRMASIDRLG